MNAAYQTLIVKFSEPIKVLDGIFDDAEAWVQPSAIAGKP